jgi:hypothetical protein
MDVRRLCLLGVLWEAASATADHSFREVLPGEPDLGYFLTEEKTKQAMYEQRNTARVRVTIVAVETQYVLRILSLCL